MIEFFLRRRDNWPCVLSLSCPSFRHSLERGYPDGAYKDHEEDHTASPRYNVTMLGPGLRDDIRKVDLSQRLSLPPAFSHLPIARNIGPRIVVDLEALPSLLNR